MGPFIAIKTFFKATSITGVCKICDCGWQLMNQSSKKLFMDFVTNPGVVFGQTFLENPFINSEDGSFDVPRQLWSTLMQNLDLTFRDEILKFGFVSHWNESERNPSNM